MASLFFDNISLFRLGQEGAFMCGVFGAVARTIDAEADIGKISYAGLFPLQHRGQESAGINTWQDGKLRIHKAMGTIDSVFQPKLDRKALVGFVRTHPDLDYEDLEYKLDRWERKHQDAHRKGEESAVQNPLDRLSGRASIGHVRYSTRGESGKKNIHPLPFVFQGNPGAIAHNGNLVRLERLREIVATRSTKFVFKSDTDTELISALIATSTQDVFEDALIETLHLLEGAFSLVILYDGFVYAVRDKHAIRPLFVGKSEKYFLVASETCSLDTLHAEDIHEVELGSICRIGVDTTHIIRWATDVSSRACVFEGIYFSRPDSLFIRDKRVNAVRVAMGRVLAREHVITNADIVVPIPDSGSWAAIGYAEPSGIPICHALVRGRVGRTFIEPIKEVRKKLQRLKLSPIIDEIRGKRVILVDDSIVRGTTITSLIRRLREVGARSVYVLSASPPILGSCHLGIDTPYAEELIAYDKEIDEIRKEIGADYLGYLSIEGMYEAIDMNRSNFCDGCLTGEYPVEPEKPAITG